MDILRAISAITVPERVYDVYVFDLDGTIYLGDELLPGAQRLIAELRRLGRPIRFISNNPTREPQQYAAKLSQLGLPTPAHEIVNTTVATTRWLLDNAPEARKAGTIVGATFLSNFVGDTPWAHLDIAGVGDNGRASYLDKGGTGFGVRLLTELALSF